VSALNPFSFSSRVRVRVRVGVSEVGDRFGVPRTESVLVLVERAPERPQLLVGHATSREAEAVAQRALKLAEVDHPGAVLIHLEEEPVVRAIPLGQPAED
jgi:hypothetical protein